MPEIGLMFCKCHHPLESIPIILLTAKYDDELRNRMLWEGVQDDLIRPFSPEELRESHLIDFFSLRMSPTGWVVTNWFK